MSSHPQKFCSHEQNRNKVCLLCCRKANTKKRNMTLTDQDISRIKQFVQPDFDRNNPKFPNALCGTCRCKLTRKTKSPELEIPKLKDFNSMIEITPATRSNLPCNCYICNIGRDKGFSKLPVKVNNILICTLCIGVINKGMKHVCTEANAADNVINLMSDLTEKTKSQVTSKLLDMFPKEDNTCSLSTRGRFRRVTINPKPETSSMFVAENFTSIKTQLNLSHNSIGKIANMIRSVQGKFNES